MKDEFKWGSLPVQWIRDGGLLAFTSDHPSSVAALKLYLALSVWALDQRFSDDNEPGVFLACSPTYSNLQQLTGLDRGQIKPGLDLLAQMKLLNVKRGKPNIYELLGTEKKGWMKIPEALVEKGLLTEVAVKRTHVAVHERAKVVVDSLKIYLFLLSARSVETNRAKVTYDKIIEKTGVPRRRIRRSISLLVTCDLIHVESTFLQTANGLQPSCNSYFMTGLARFKQQHQDLVLGVSA